MNAKEAAQLYIEKGWACPFPLPEDAKYPPAVGTTGNIPNVTKETVQELWRKAGSRGNLGLRMQTRSKKFDVIGIDIDHYGSKQGRVFLEELEASLGSLNLEDMVKSTRRGPDDKSGQYFFLVPAGKKWQSEVCSDVDMIQPTHRYSAVWPSTVDGRMYQWFYQGEECEIPAVKDLPKLPDNWVNYLEKGAARLREPGVVRAFQGTKKGDRYRVAIEWLRNNISNYSKDPISSSLEKVSKSEEFQEKLAGNAHDTMVSAVHAAVSLGTEGHQGLKAALHHIHHLFVDEVTLRRSGNELRSEKVAEEEYKNALVTEVEKVIEDVESGTRTIVSSNLGAMPRMADILLNAAVERRPRGVDIENPKFTESDQGHAEMFLDYWEKDILVTKDRKDEEFAVWTPPKGRFIFHAADELFRHLYAATSDRLDFEAKIIYKELDRLNEESKEGQLPSDAPDVDALMSEAGKLKARAMNIRSTSRSRQILAQLHSVADIRVRREEFDRAGELLGLPNAQTLDLDLVPTDKNPSRPSSREDMLTMETSAVYLQGNTNKVWDTFLETFLPDENLRHFVQKCIGYSLVSGNPEKLLFFLYGPANTGKTTILEACSAALGDYAGPMNAHKLFARSNGGPSPEFISNMHKRMVFLSEVGDGHNLSANTVKQVTGNDSQNTRRIFSNEMISGAPLFTPYVSTNSVPQIAGSDEALRNRLVIIPFTNATKPQGSIPHSKDLKKNKAIQMAVLAWIVEGYRMYREEGLNRESFPAEVAAQTEDFVSETSPFQLWADENLFHREGSDLFVSEIWSSWNEFYLQKGLKREDAMSEIEMRRSLKNNGFSLFRSTKNKYRVKNVGLRNA